MIAISVSRSNLMLPVKPPLIRMLLCDFPIPLTEIRTHSRQTKSVERFTKGTILNMNLKGVVIFLDHAKIKKGSPQPKTGLHP